MGKILYIRTGHNIVSICQGGFYVCGMWVLTNIRILCIPYRNTYQKISQRHFFRLEKNGSMKLLRKWLDLHKPVDEVDRILIAEGINRLGPINPKGDALSEKIGSVRIVSPSFLIKKVECPIQIA